MIMVRSSSRSVILPSIIIQDALRPKRAGLRRTVTRSQVSLDRGAYAEIAARFCLKGAPRRCLIEAHKDYAYILDCWWKSCPRIGLFDFETLRNVERRETPHSAFRCERDGAGPSGRVHGCARISSN